MSDLVSRIGVRKEYDANLGSTRGHIKKSPVNGKPPSSIHHSKYATSKHKLLIATGSPTHALFSTSDSQPPSLLSRLDPMHADGASPSDATVVPLIDRILRTKADHQSREPSSMENSIIAEAPVVTPRMSAIGNGSFVNIENAISPSRTRSREHLNETTPMSRWKTSAQPSHSPSTPTSQVSELPIHERLCSATGPPLGNGPPPVSAPTDSNVQEPRNQPPTTISQIRDVLVDLVMQNSQLRPASETEKVDLDKIRDKAKDALTDDACESFVGRMQSIERQLQARQAREKSQFSAVVETVAFPDGTTSNESLAETLGNPGYLPVPGSSVFPIAPIAVPSSSDPTYSLPTPPVSAPLPNAPKAMRLHGFTYGSPRQPQQRPPSWKAKEKAKLYNLPGNNDLPQPQNHVDDDSSRTAAQVDPGVREVRLQSPGSSGIAIPMDAGFFEPPIKDDTGGDSVNTYYPSRQRSSSIGSPTYASLPPSRFGRSSRHPLSHSPDGSHRPRIPRSPRHTDHRRRLSYRSRSRSHSPNRSGLHGPTYVRRGRELHSPTSKASSRIAVRGSTRRCSPYRSNSRSRSPTQPRLSRSPRRREIDHFSNKHRRRNSYRSKSRSHSPFHSGSHSPLPPSRLPDRDSAPINRLRSDSSLSLAKHNHPSHSPHGSRSRSRPRYRSRDSRSIHDSRERENDVVYGPPRPPQTEKATTTPPVHHKKSLAQVMEPCRNVPGLWFIKMGEEDVRILEYEIDIDRETSLKWNFTSKSQPEPESVLFVQPQQRPLSLRLMCIPTQAVRSTYAKSGLGTASSEEVAATLFDLENEWPRKGTLVVAVNPHKSWGKTWLPVDLEANSSALDLTTCISEGTNVIRIIQLADMAEKVFILCAILPTTQEPDEEYFRDLQDHLAMSPGPLKLRPAVVKVA